MDSSWSSEHERDNEIVLYWQVPDHLARGGADVKYRIQMKVHGLWEDAYEGPGKPYNYEQREMVRTDEDDFTEFHQTSGFRAGTDGYNA